LIQISRSEFGYREHVISIATSCYVRLLSEFLKMHSFRNINKINNFLLSYVDSNLFLNSDIR
jgi:hypothetical protein